MITFPSFIELTRPTGEKILINSNHIIRINKGINTTHVYVTPNEVVRIKETYEEISRFLSSLGEK